jgi:hypothetical protein
VTLSTGHPIHILIGYFSTVVYRQLHSVLSLFFLHPDTSHFMLISSSSAQFCCYSFRISNNTGFQNFDRMHPYRKCWVQTYGIAIMLGALSPYQCLRRIEFFRRLVVRGCIMRLLFPDELELASMMCKCVRGSGMAFLHIPIG